ncbi:MAG: HAMP domain-containing histidine kinase [Lachnospiraceae bacterium]|nr:HAMP domain-containing histidine kinase [Lachnospiraceae bacterium]
MRKSIKKQFAGIFIFLMAATIVLCWILNTVFLKSYYIRDKEKSLFKVYGMLQNSSRLKEESFEMEFETLCSTTNIDAVVIGGNGEETISTVYDTKGMVLQLFEHLMEKNNGNVSIIEKTDDYTLQKIRETRSNLYFLEMWGYLEDGQVFILRTPVESIRESVSIANRFLAYVGIVAIIISGCLIWLVSKKITEPILQLADISERMSELDFTVRYEAHGENEIALLGSHINKLSSTLEETISELKTANNELKSDIEKKEQIDEMRKEFLSNVSHELKTPIALIQGYAEGLKECVNEDDESKDFYCDVIMDEAGRMNVMVKKLLTLNQLEFGNDIVTMERFDLVSVIEGVIQSLDILAKQKEAVIRFNYQTPLYVWADEFKVEEVVRNYLSNALNHVEGERIIDVKITSKGDLVRISVFNTGEPIPQDSLDKLWVKFYKVDKARTREYGGSGIGLSIVKAIMESFNREYGVINYDNGVEFWFELEQK